MARRFATYAALGIGAATAALGLVSVAVSIIGIDGQARPELITGGIALMLATGLIGDGNPRKKGNRPGHRKAGGRDRR